MYGIPAYGPGPMVVSRGPNGGGYYDGRGPFMDGGLFGQGYPNEFGPMGPGYGEYYMNGPQYGYGQYGSNGVMNRIRERRARSQQYRG